MLLRNSTLSSSTGGAGAVGFMYDLQAGHFLLDAGIGIAGGHTLFLVPDWEYTLTNQTDKEGEKFDYIYQMHGRKDSYTNMMVQVPLLFGGQYKRFYALAGVKIGLNVWTRTGMSGQVNTIGRYFGYDENGQKLPLFDDFTNQPENQFYVNHPLSQTGRTNLNVNLDASFEIGARLGFLTDHTGYDVPKSTTQYRIALFVDYGLLDMHTAGSFSTIEASSSYNPDDMLSSIQMHDILSTRNVASAVTNLFVGVKLTVLFELPQAGKCVICQDAYKGF